MFEQTQEDLKEFHTICSQFWKRIPDDAWDKKTGERAKDWTLHETLAHVLSIAQAFNKATDAALRGEDIDYKNFTSRDDLWAWNDVQIARLAQLAPNGLIVQLLQELRIAHDKVASITEETADHTVKMPNFNRGAKAIDYARWQISHAGIIHGAQVTKPLNSEPLWLSFSSEFTQRVIGYYLSQWSMAYWQEYGKDESQTINFHISGDGGSDWHLVAAPDGGTYGEGTVDGAEYDLFFESPHVFFSVFSNHISIRKAMVSGQMRMASDVRDTFAILGLFSAKRPAEPIE